MKSNKRVDSTNKQITSLLVDRALYWTKRVRVLSSYSQEKHLKSSLSLLSGCFKRSWPVHVFHQGSYINLCCSLVVNSGRSWHTQSHTHTRATHFSSLC